MSGGFFEFHQRVNQRRGALPRTAEPSAAQQKPSAQPLTVSQITARIERVLKDQIKETLHVRGQISNYKPHQASGHVYFTLKDAVNCLNCVMWQSDAARLKFIPDDGMELVASGKISIYGKRGQYQLQVSSLHPLGQGALELAFQQLRAKLEAEGLFAAERKKPLPRFPTRIVLITSREAAGCHDMLKVLGRFPWLKVMIYPVPVQGDGAARRIAAAITHVSAKREMIGAEVIVLGRGGGSLEDLWAFNEEAVARALAASRVPVVTGIGHEVDVSIADLIADHHAHTPTEAAQVITAHWRTARDDVDEQHLRLRRSFRAIVQDARHRLRLIEQHEAFRRPLSRIEGYRQVLDDRQKALAAALSDRINAARHRLQESDHRLERRLPAMIREAHHRLTVLLQELDTRMGRRLRHAVDELSRISALLGECHPRHRLQLRQREITSLEERLQRALQINCSQRSQQLNAASRQLEALNPGNVLKRGFTVTSRRKDGAILRSAQQLKPGDRIITRFADGQVESVTEDSKQLPLFE